MMSSVLKKADKLNLSLPLSLLWLCDVCRGGDTRSAASSQVCNRMQDSCQARQYAIIRGALTGTMWWGPSVHHEPGE